MRNNRSTGNTMADQVLNSDISEFIICYKARLKGIRVVKEPEDYTSHTCCMCGTTCRSNRVHRGLYACNQCGALINADVNGAINILKRYLPGQISVSWSSGCLAQPAVTRFAWRENQAVSVRA